MTAQVVRLCDYEHRRHVDKSIIEPAVVMALPTVPTFRMVEGEIVDTRGLIACLPENEVQ